MSTQINQNDEQTKDLSIEQLDDVSGGNPILIGIAIGVAGNAVYDLSKKAAKYAWAGGRSAAHH